jgi:uncharacterized protein (TIGR03067 family)
MRSGLALAVAALLMALSGTADDKKDEKPLDPDLKKLQGKWEIVYHETAGEEDTEGSKWTMEVRGDAYTFTAGKVTLTGRVRIDSTKAPRRVEYATTEGDEVQEYVGIYELDGDTYKTCDVSKGKDRPTEFKTKDPTGQVAVWKRVKVRD